METIKKICEVKKEVIVNDYGDKESAEGYEVQTNKNIYGFYIENFQNCCEDWGYMCSNDDFDFFIGKNISEINYMKTTGEIIAITESELDCGGAMFVNIKTTDGYVLEFAVYNAHNGYYGHYVWFAKNKKILERQCI